MQHNLQKLTIGTGADACLFGGEMIYVDQQCRERTEQQEKL